MSFQLFLTQRRSRLDIFQKWKTSNGRRLGRHTVAVWTRRSLRSSSCLRWSCDCCVSCSACGSDPYLHQRAFSMKLLLRQTHTEFALQGVPLARLHLTKPSCTSLLLVACGNKPSRCSCKASFISSYEANAHCRRRRWRRCESSLRFSKN